MYILIKTHPLKKLSLETHARQGSSYAKENNSLHDHERLSLFTESGSRGTLPAIRSSSWINDMSFFQPQTAAQNPK